MVQRTLSKRIYGVIGLMLIYGNTPRDIMKMMWRRKIKLLSVVLVIAVAVMLTGCGTANKKGGSMSEFFKAIGSGDISVIKEKFKGAKDKEDGSWDQIEHNSTGVE